MIKKITKNTILEEILKIPDAEKILAKYNFPCISCPMAAYESKVLKIGQTAKIYGIDVDNLIKELNNQIKKTKKLVSGKKAIKTRSQK